MRILIFGYGYMGKIRHQVLRRHPAVREIKVVDPGLDPSGTDLGDQLLPADQPIPWSQFDALFVCTPNNVTADIVVEGLRRCGRVFCEKPPGRNWEDFCRIADAAASVPGHTLAFGFNHRLHPSVQAAKAMIGQGGLGEILYLKGTYGKSGGRHYQQSWRNRREISGGGILLDQGIHMLDLFQLFLGSVAPVEAVLVDSFWNCGVEDNAFVLLRSERGTPAFLHSSATLWKHTFRLEIGCQNGYLIASGLLSQTGSYGREELVIGKRQFEDEALALGNPREEIIHFDRDESWEKEVQEFLAAIQERRPPVHGTLEDARRVMEVIRDVYAMVEFPSAPARSG
ncbi:MAG: Gfo/Idh/MocA family oxidoreductase [Candidatus Omnitrophica bacterium]|nr:Gfo/Idh/MocA family oxidoreductase [Candidatus Omnitrophota bacterium]